MDILVDEMEEWIKPFETPLASYPFKASSRLSVESIKLP